MEEQRIPSCSCNKLKCCKINSIKQFEELKHHFEAEDNAYKCICNERSKKVYSCLKCKREWLFKYPDFPVLGEIYLMKTNIVMNKIMKAYLSQFTPWAWSNAVKYSPRVSVRDNYIRQDENITYIIVRLVGRDSYDAWIEKPIAELNGYTPRELAANYMGRIVLKSYLLDMSRHLGTSG